MLFICINLILRPLDGGNLVFYECIINEIIRRDSIMLRLFLSWSFDYKLFGDTTEWRTELIHN